MRCMVSPETETLAKQHKTESNKLPEKEQEHVRPTSLGGERKLGFRDLRETLKKEHEQEQEEERDRSSRDHPDRKR